MTLEINSYSDLWIILYWGQILLKCKALAEDLKVVILNNTKQNLAFIKLKRTNKYNFFSIKEENGNFL